MNYSVTANGQVMVSSLEVKPQAIYDLGNKYLPLLEKASSASEKSALLAAFNAAKVAVYASLKA